MREKAAGGVPSDAQVLQWIQRVSGIAVIAATEAWRRDWLGPVGGGALPGIIALVLFNVGIIVKLVSEAIESNDAGPLDSNVYISPQRTGNQTSL